MTDRDGRHRRRPETSSRSASEASPSCPACSTRRPSRRMKHELLAGGRRGPRRLGGPRLSGRVDGAQPHGPAPGVRAIPREPGAPRLPDPLLGDTCILYAYTSSSMPPSGANFSHRVHVDSPRVIPGYWTNVGVMVALDDYTTENGATRFLPDSFERAEPPSVEEFLEQSEETFPKAGEAVVFNARTWHMGGMNRTSDRRATRSR